MTRNVPTTTSPSRTRCRNGDMTDGRTSLERLSRSCSGCATIQQAWAASSMVEQLTLNQLVEGSSPSRLTTRTTTQDPSGTTPKAIILPRRAARESREVPPRSQLLPRGKGCGRVAGRRRRDRHPAADVVSGSASRARMRARSLDYEPVRIIHTPATDVQYGTFRRTVHDGLRMIRAGPYHPPP